MLKEELKKYICECIDKLSINTTLHLAGEVSDLLEVYEENESLEGSPCGSVDECGCGCCKQKQEVAQVKPIKNVVLGDTVVVEKPQKVEASKEVAPEPEEEIIPVAPARRPRPATRVVDEEVVEAPKKAKPDTTEQDEAISLEEPRTARTTRRGTIPAQCIADDFENESFDEPVAKPQAKPAKTGMASVPMNPPAPKKSPLNNDDDDFSLDDIDIKDDSFE